MSNDKPVAFETTLRVRDDCLCLHVQRAARALARRYDEAFRLLDLTNGQFSLMMALNRPDPPTMTEVSALLALDRTTLTAKLKPLERRGLVEVTTDPADRRSRRMRLTEAGLTQLAAAMPLWDRAQAETEHLLAGADADGLRRALIALS